MENIEVIIPEPLFEKFYKTGNLENFDKDKANAFEYEGEKYVYTGSYGNRLIVARKAVMKEHYSGNVTPINQSDHVIAVNSGLRQRGYYARLLNINDIPHVLTDEVCFLNQSKISN